MSRKISRGRQSSRAFTLIEALSVVSIIGILATLTFYGVNSYQQTGRDAKRKSDLYAISQGFEARKLDQTCSTAGASLTGVYFDYTNIGGGDASLDPTLHWQDFSKFASSTTATNDCNGYRTYLTVTPTDPQSNTGYGYYFSISGANGVKGKNYRLAASLERPTTQQRQDCSTGDASWQTTYGGPAYDCAGTSTDFLPLTHRAYTYYVGN